MKEITVTPYVIEIDHQKWCPKNYSFSTLLLSKILVVPLDYWLPQKKLEYEVCLKSNGTVHAARKTFIAEKKVLLSMMLQCLMVSKTKFQQSVTTTFFFARFSVKTLFLW